MFIVPAGQSLGVIINGLLIAHLDARMLTFAAESCLD